MKATERFLVVDDDEAITEALCKVIRALGYEAVGHTDPRAALEESAFDLVVSDFMMPGMSGVEFLQQVRARRPEAVRLMMTASHDMKVAASAVNEVEIFKLLSKPWNLAELRAGLGEAVAASRLAAENRRLEAELKERNAQLERLNATLEAQVVERTNALLEGMIRALDARDSDTQWHSWRVARFTRRIAEQLGVTGDELQQIEQGALLHDIGKIGVRDAILLKPGPLSPEEWVEMKRHPEIGFRVLEHIPFMSGPAQIVYQHQEKWDGRGYPQGLVGEQICLGARIFSIADALDAICSDRPYRRGSPIEIALREIARLAGTQFDPRCVEAFLAIPPEDWLRLRREIEGLELQQRRRSSGEFPAA